MRTEITIPIAFDTTPLEEKLERDGEAELERIMREIVMGGVTKALPNKQRYRYDSYGFRDERDPEIDWGKYMKEIFYGFLEEHIEEIIDEAALLLAQRATSRKAWKQVLTELKEEDADGQAD